MSEKVKPCPFCGCDEVEIIQGSTFRWRIVQCTECGATAGETRIQTMGDGTPTEWEEKAKIDAIESWNTRATKE